jgi:hypothetical protein
MTRSQRTLAGTGFEKYTKATRRAQFLAEMDRVSKQPASTDRPLDQSPIRHQQGDAVTLYRAIAGFGVCRAEEDLAPAGFAKTHGLARSRFEASSSSDRAF